MENINKNSTAGESANGSDCAAIARALEDMMTIANISGFISQYDGKARQFRNTEVSECANHATLRFGFDEKDYIAEIRRAATEKRS